MIIYLGPRLLSGSSGTPTTRSVVDTALHTGKDLFVAPPPFSGILPKACLTAIRGALHFRSGRHCRHLYPYGRRALPATCCRFCPPKVVAEPSIPRLLRGTNPSLCSGRSVLQLPAAGKIGVCSDFPPFDCSKSDHLARSERIIPHSIRCHLMEDLNQHHTIALLEASFVFEPDAL